MSSTRLFTRLFLIGAFALCAGTAVGADLNTMGDSARQAPLLLAVLLALLGAELRRRVHAGMWASREKAFLRRTVQSQRRLRAGRSR